MLLPAGNVCSAMGMLRNDLLCLKHHLLGYRKEYKSETPEGTSGNLATKSVQDDARRCKAGKVAIYTTERR